MKWVYTRLYNGIYRIHPRVFKKLEDLGYKEFCYTTVYLWEGSWSRIKGYLQLDPDEYIITEEEANRLIVKTELEK